MSAGRDQLKIPLPGQSGTHGSATPEGNRGFSHGLYYARDTTIPTPYDGSISRHSSRNHNTPTDLGPSHQSPTMFNIHQAQSDRMGLDAFDLHLLNPSPPVLDHSSLSDSHKIPSGMETAASHSQHQLEDLQSGRPSSGSKSLSRPLGSGHSHPEYPLALPPGYQQPPGSLFSRQLPTSDTSSSGFHSQPFRQRILGSQGQTEQSSHGRNFPHPGNQSATSSSSSPAISSPTTRLSERSHGHPTAGQQAARDVYRPTRPSTPPSQTHTVRHLALGHAPPIANGVHLISPKDVLPDRLGVIFPFELFNAVQSKSFASVYKTNDNVVISAPTGSGKTVIFELAICRLLCQKTDQNFKVVYIAPTKSLCSERASDWETKFRHLNIGCAELTGDTFSNDMPRVRAAQIIVTTPEKWDSITRRWEDHRKLLELVELLLIDEIHFLKDVRGATLEALVCRMKTQRANVRCIALSATVPNSEDVAEWLGRGSTKGRQPAILETFGEEFRPVRLQKYVYGVHCSGNAFQCEAQLDTKLCEVILKDNQKKPIIVFCFTRNSCELTAKKLGQLWMCAASDEKPWPAPGHRVNVTNEGLQQVSRQGVAFHHAGLEQKDRAAVEKAYLEGQLHVICCTSTLSVGINLPCHTVILKGTVGYQDTKLVEFSDLEIMQMLGRAGRPQFDTAAVGIILTRAENKARYEAMASGKEVLESSLHINLIQHLNSEICLGTIKGLEVAKDWLKGTFLGVRLRSNPSHYQIDSQSPPPERLHVDRWIEEICERDIELLREADLVKSCDSVLQCTPAGQAMSRYMVRFETMKIILGMPTGTSIPDLLTTLAKAEEFKDLYMKSNERTLYRTLNELPFLRYKVKAKNVTEAWHKISIIIQFDIGGGEFPPMKPNTTGNVSKNQYNVTRRLVVDRMKSLLRCVIECKGAKKDSETVRNAMELLRSITAGGWEGLPSQLLEVPGIGPVSMRKLTAHGITSISSLLQADYTAIENFLTRKPPYGKNLMNATRMFPKLGLEVKLSEVPDSGDTSENGLAIVKIEATLSCQRPEAGGPLPGGRFGYLTFLAETSDKQLIYFWRGREWRVKGNGVKMDFFAHLGRNQSHVTCHFHCDNLVGLGVSKTVNRPLSTIKSFKKVPVKSSQPVSSAKQQAPGKNIAGTSTAPIEIDEGGLSDGDLIEALEQVQYLPATHPAERAFENDGDDNDDDDDDDDDGDDEDDGDGLPAVKAIMRSSQVSSREQDIHQTVQLPNGRWKCNHSCATYGVTKTGKPCKHNCCHEGLDRRPKARARTEDKGIKRRLENEDQSPMGVSDSKSQVEKDRQRSSMPPPKKPKPFKGSRLQRKSATSLAPDKQVKKYVAPTLDQIQKAAVIDLSQDSSASSGEGDDSKNVNKSGALVVPKQGDKLDHRLEDWRDPEHFDFKGFTYPDPNQTIPVSRGPFKEGGMDVTLTPEPMLDIAFSGGLSEECQYKLLEHSRLFGLPSSPNVASYHTPAESSMPGSAYQGVDEPESDIYKLESELSSEAKAFPTPEGHIDEANVGDTIVVADSTKATEPEWVNDMDTDMMDFFRNSNITFV